jgi:uncharacterized Zn finger protein
MADRNKPARGWWGQRWLDYVINDVQGWMPSESKLKSGRRAKAELAFSRGRVVAEVASGSSGNSFTATLKVKPLGQREWKRAIETIAAQPELAHGLLAGSPGPDLEAALNTAGIVLFPLPSASYPLKCTCREGWGCRHTNALLMHGADLVDGAPLLWLHVLGMERQELLAAVRARLADNGGPALAGEARAEAAAAALHSHGAGSELSAERFWSTAHDPAEIAVRPGNSSTPDGLLRLLGPLPLPEPQRTVTVSVTRRVQRGEDSWEYPVHEPRKADDLLRDYMIGIGKAAVELASGDRTITHADEPLPGKPFPVGDRLAAEVAEAVRQEEGLVPFARIRAACPTAVNLSDQSVAWALAESDAWPPDVVILAGRYYGTQSVALADIGFRHVVTFSEWRSGQLANDADWVRALAATGCFAPFAIQAEVFAQLRPEVGDELLLTVIDPEQPLLTAALRRRAERTGGLEQGAAASRMAARTLKAHMADWRAHQLSEMDAAGILLGEGFYRAEHEGLVPMWLLPQAASGEIFMTPDRWLVTDQWRAGYAWMRRWGGGGWPKRDALLNRFAAALLSRGESKGNVTAAYRLAALWCQHVPIPHDQAEEVPPLAAFLEFLWNVAPVELRRNRIQEELGPTMLAQWFTFLGEQHRQLRAAYQEHLAACASAAAFKHRVLTLPRSAVHSDAFEAWKTEGLRWIGPELYLDQ